MTPRPACDCFDAHNSGHARTCPLLKWLNSADYHDDLEIPAPLVRVRPVKTDSNVFD